MKNQLQKISGLRNRYLVFIDLFLVLLTPAIALVIRTDGVDALRVFLSPLLLFTCVMAASKLAVLFGAGLYRQYWRYASVEELRVLVRASFLCLVAEVVVFFALLGPLELLPLEFPRSLPLLDGLLTLAAIGSIRLGVRLVAALHGGSAGRGIPKLTLIVGAGDAGSMILKELQANRQLGLMPAGFVDDDPSKCGQRIHGVRVLGGLDELPRILVEHGIEQVIIAMPTAPGKIIRTVVHECANAGVSSKTIPGLFEIVRGTARVEQVRAIQLEDLLRRGAVQTETAKVASLIRNSRVMITGAGGSIGSELCHQIRECDPSELILVGHGENSIFEIVAALRERPQPGMTIRPVIADIRDRERMDQVFREHMPHLVFHAAAHKHVPLMEVNAADAITNNVLGTRNMVDLAERFKVDRFVLISSDKAVNPTSIMGATKRIAELIVQEAANRTKARFMVVRFGNVLGSRGSVVPMWRRQIQLGGPVTVTHPDVRRYFMTIPEAVQLVLQAGTMGEGGEVFVLDMGDQIKILDLARDLIRLSGLEEGSDIDIVFTGLRPGEKLFEELFFGDDVIERTSHEKIMVYRNGSPYIHGEETAWKPLQPSLWGTGPASYERPLRLDVDTLVEASRQGNLRAVDRVLRKLVPEFAPLTPLADQQITQTRAHRSQLRSTAGPGSLQIPLRASSGSS